MNESDTRLKKIDPALRRLGWGVAPESDIFTEQRAYVITPGRVQKEKSQRNPKKIDYLLTYRKQKLAIIEAKSDEKDVSEGVEQAKEYAYMMNIRYTYATNGDRIWAIDMETGKEGEVDTFPTPQQLWRMTFPEVNDWRDRFMNEPFNLGGGRKPRYYQEIAVNNVLKAVADNKKRILLTLATGTGKTYIAFQIAWKLFHTRWNIHNAGNGLPKILFLSDRNILSNQAKNDFGQFQDDAIARIEPSSLKKMNGRVPTAQNLYFTIFQTFMTGDTPVYKQYPKDFFDFIIIDECHRGGANDESQWREILEYFEPATQLGLTATPKKDKNVNTYEYFGGKPVYVYSLKQGIEDGFLTPYRLCISESNIDTYKYNPDDTVEGDIDKDKEYTEQDFYNGNIEMEQRDEYRVKEFLAKINPDEKTIVFCATQNHAMKVRDMINKNSRKKHPSYCVRVTANDGSEGDRQLKQFQDNEKTIPTILTTSQKLSTGVDARNVRNIVLMRPVDNIIEYKQIIGRGTRLFEGKYYFTIYDFVGAYHHFEDPEWDGEPIPSPESPDVPSGGRNKSRVCPRCGQSPCVCVPEPCEVCGNLPCTCEGGKKKRKVVVKLGKLRELTLYTDWNEKFLYEGNLISIDEFITILFGRLPQFFDSEMDLRQQWASPDTREKLLDQLKREGFDQEKLQRVQSLISAEDSDLLDVLECLAFHTTPMERQRRVELVKADIMERLNRQHQEFADFVLSQYISHGFNQLSQNNLPELIKLKYGTVQDAMRQMGDAKQILQSFLGMQKVLYGVW